LARSHLESITKTHRFKTLRSATANIIAPDEGMKLSYVDFGQFEAGIMGALSGDQGMLDLFASGDLYSLVAEMYSSTPQKESLPKGYFFPMPMG